MAATPKRANRKTDEANAVPTDDPSPRRTAPADAVALEIELLAARAHEAVDAGVARLRARQGALTSALENLSRSNGEDAAVAEIADEARGALKRALRKFRKRYSLAKPARKSKPNSDSPSDASEPRESDAP
jgi:hypothetical protein